MSQSQVSPSEGRNAGATPPLFSFARAGVLLADWDTATSRDLGRIALVAFPANALLLRGHQRS
jgi:hypothetical protein